MILPTVSGFHTKSFLGETNQRKRNLSKKLLI